MYARIRGSEPAARPPTEGDHVRRGHQRGCVSEPTPGCGLSPDVRGRCFYARKTTLEASQYERATRRSGRSEPPAVRTYLCDTAGSIPVRETIDERTVHGCKATLVFDTGGPVGSDQLLIVKPIDADSEWVVNRWFYFDEQTEAYMWNFGEKICADVEYRRRSLEETADWKRVANLYEPLARRLFDELSRSERSDFPVMNDDSRHDSGKLESLCEELFEEIRAIVRQGTDKHPEAVYDEKELELHRWLADASE